MWAPFSNLSFKTKGLILVSVPIAFELLFVLFLTFYVVDQSNRFREIQESKLLIRLIQRSHGAITRAYLIFSYSPRSKTIRSAEAEKIAREIRSEGRFEQKINEENIGPELSGLVQEIRAMRGTVLALTDELKDAAKEHSDQRMYKLAFTMIPAITDARDIYRRLVDMEERIRAESPDRKKQKDELLIIVLSGIISSIIISLSLLYFFTRSVISRLNEIGAKAQSIAVGLPVSQPIDGSDEIAELDRSIFNAAVKLKEIQRRESAILEGASDLILSLDSRLRIKTIGDICERLWGLNKEVLLQRSVLTLIEQDLREETRLAFDDIKKSAVETKLETRIRRADGTFGLFAWYINWSAEKESYYCVVRDVTEAKDMEQLRQYFLSMAGHDLRSPLTAIAMDLQMIREGVRGPVSADIASEVKRLDNDLSLLIGFVNELLDLEKLEANINPPVLSAVSPASVFDAAIEAVSIQAEQSKISIKPPGADVLVSADETQVEKAFSGLLSSCIRMAQEDSVIRLEIKEENQFAVVSVSVSGLEIPPVEQDEIFDKLRPQSTSGNSKVSPGLGLAVARAVALLNGGAVGMSSPSTFWMSFPVYTEIKAEGDS